MRAVIGGTLADPYFGNKSAAMTAGRVGLPDNAQTVLIIAPLLVQTEIIAKT